MATVTRLPILDETGKVRLWLNAGRGVAVWESKEIGVMRPTMFTPGDVTTPPHWAYVGTPRVVRDAAELLFYAPLHIIRAWSDTPSGIRACEKALATYHDETREAPIGTVYTTYVMKRFTMGSVVIRPDSEGGTILDMVDIPAMGGIVHSPPRLMHVEFKVGIQSWTAIEERA